MKTSSAKAKGRNLQNYIVKKLLAYFPELSDDDVTGRSMGASGEDVLLSPRARSLAPISIEAKNQEKLNVWAAFEQAKTNCKQYQPVLIMKKNRSTPLAVVDLDYFLYLLAGKQSTKEPHE